MRKKLALAIALATASAAIPMPTTAQECYMGEIKWFAMNWVPKGYAKAEGQILDTEQHSSLFSLLGNAYGGNGQTTFALPDLRGRVAVGQGNGENLSARTVGQRFGSETVALDASQLPSHHHQYNDTRITATRMDEARGGSNIDVVADITQRAESAQTENAGGGQPLPVEQPSLVLTPGICIIGTFPPHPN